MLKDLPLPKHAYMAYGELSMDFSRAAVTYYREQGPRFCILSLPACVQLARTTMTCSSICKKTGLPTFR